jgi:hypothetical protein
MPRSFWLLAFVAAAAPLAAQPAPPRNPAQGSGIVIELETEFVEKYKDRATIEGEFEPIALSKVHPAKNDGEVHVAGFLKGLTFPCVAEVMNAAKNRRGSPAEQALRAAAAAKQKVKIAGAWRLWCEHAGTRDQIQGKAYPIPQPGVPKSNPDHVFEIHPVTRVEPNGGAAVAALDSVSETAGHKPHDAQKAFLLGYENVPCRIEPLGANRVRIITKGTGFNFTEFIFRAGDTKTRELDDGGHALLGSVLDTDGELVVRRRRVVTMKGTAADEVLAGATEGKRFRVVGIPRISLKLVSWRLENAKDPRNPLTWDLPYEMIIVAAEAVPTDDDD